MTTKVMVSFPDEFLQEVDRIAQEEHRSRSELVREALRLYIGLRQDQGQLGASPLVRKAVAMQDNVPRLTPGKGEDSTTGARRIVSRTGCWTGYMFQMLLADDMWRAVAMHGFNKRKGKQ